MNTRVHPEIPFSQAAIQLDTHDPVAIARQYIPAGVILLADIRTLPFRQLELRDEIPAGHKLALIGISEGSEIRRYGYRIGIATQDISPGDWIHSHNMNVGNLARDFKIQVTQNKSPASFVDESRFFMGYPRSPGVYGTRNTIAVISTVSCSAQTAQAIAEAFSPDRLAGFPNIDGVVAITHTAGCCVPIGGIAFQYLQRSLINVARHPNVGGVVFISLGCEGNQMADLFDALKNGVREPGAAILGPYLDIQKEGGISRTIKSGVEAVNAMLPKVNDITRVPAPLSALTVALQCGGSDGWSGVTSNPLVGRVSDKLVQGGGTVVLSETPEIYGAEHLLTGRAISQEVGQKLIDRIQWWQAQADLLGFSLDNNPTPGNKEGGLTTIFEKSLGAVSKGGSTPLMNVYEYAERVTTKGLVFMDTPGYDPVAITGQVAGGCNLVLFTTGRGSVFGGNLVPCIKIASNTDLYNRMTEDMDFNAGTLLDGAPMDEAAERLLEKVILAASGSPTKSEASGNRDLEFIPWQPGAIL
jgi:altronate hydrolase